MTQNGRDHEHYIDKVINKLTIHLFYRFKQKQKLNLHGTTTPNSIHPPTHTPTHSNVSNTEMTSHGNAKVSVPIAIFLQRGAKRSGDER
jgi:hypothetical protein